MWEVAGIALVSIVAALFAAHLLGRPDRRAAKVNGGAHRIMFTVRAATAPAWAYSGGLSARVDLYDEAIIVTSTPPRGWTLRRCEVRELTRTHGGLVSLYGPGSRLARAYDHGWLGTSDEQHALLERWLAGELHDLPASE